MKRILSLTLFALISLVLFAACGNTPSSSTPTLSLPAISDATESEAESFPPEAENLAQPIFDALLPHMGFGGTVEMYSYDISGGDTAPLENFLNFAGVQSQTYQQDGGMLVVVQTTAGSADAVKSLVENFRDNVLSQSDAYRNDFPEAFNNLQNAIIAASGDFVVFAVPNTGTDLVALEQIINEQISK